jgi:hypothetical protein
MTARIVPAKFNRPLFAAAATIVVGATMALPHTAYAWWGPRFGVGISVPLVVPAPPVYYPPPPPAYYAPPPAYAYYGGPPAYYRPHPRVWIRPHRNWAGAWVRGHWAWR